MRFASRFRRTRFGVHERGRASFEFRCAVELSQVAEERLDDLRSTTTKELTMNKRTALIGATVVVALALLGWFSIGQSSKKSNATTTTAMPGMTMSDTTSSTTSAAMPGTSAGQSGAMTGMKPLVAGANGTRASAGGLTLEPKHTMFMARQPTKWELRIKDKMGMPVTKFQPDQTKLMHLIVVRSDLTNYQHLHPVLGRGGIRLPSVGTYRAIADFTTGGRRYALGVAIHVPGTVTQAPLPAEAMEATSDGFTVMTMHDAPKAGRETKLQFTISRNGQPETALLPYLGAYGHLVALRKSDLAYSHVHPTAEDLTKGSISFTAEFPTPGGYRLFLQFRTSTGVHTAPFTVEVS
jgi:hypothetical protein